MSETHTTHTIVLGTRDDGAVIILEETFRYSDDFRGATGAVVYPVTRAEIDEALAEKQEYLREMADELDAHGEARQRILRMSNRDYLEYRFETYQDLSREDIAAALGTSVPERYTLTSIGRIFPHELAGLTVREGDDVQAALAAIAEHGDGVA